MLTLLGIIYGTVDLDVKYAGDTYRYIKYAAYPALLQIRCKYATKYAAGTPIWKRCMRVS